MLGLFAAKGEGGCLQVCSSGREGPVLASGPGVHEYFKSDSASSPSVCITPKESFERVETLPVIQHLAIALQTISSLRPALRCFQAQLSGAGRLVWLEPETRMGLGRASGVQGMRREDPEGLSPSVRKFLWLC